jgi:hypothetical protein
LPKKISLSSKKYIGLDEIWFMPADVLMGTITMAAVREPWAFKLESVDCEAAITILAEASPSRKFLNSGSPKAYLHHGLADRKKDMAFFALDSLANIWQIIFALVFLLDLPPLRLQRGGGRGGL